MEMDPAPGVTVIHSDHRDGSCPGVIPCAPARLAATRSVHRAAGGYCWILLHITTTGCTRELHNVLKKYHLYQLVCLLFPGHNLMFSNKTTPQILIR